MNTNIKTVIISAVVASGLVFGGNVLIDQREGTTTPIVDSNLIEFCDALEYCYKFTDKEFNEIRDILLQEKSNGTISSDNLVTLEAMNKVEKERNN